MTRFRRFPHYVRVYVDRHVLERMVVRTMWGMREFSPELRMYAHFAAIGWDVEDG